MTDYPEIIAETEAELSAYKAIRKAARRAPASEQRRLERKVKELEGVLESLRTLAIIAQEASK